jgi:hypothetical protein
MGLEAEQTKRQSWGPHRVYRITTLASHGAIRARLIHTPPAKGSEWWAAVAVWILWYVSMQENEVTGIFSSMADETSGRGLLSCFYLFFNHQCCYDSFRQARNHAASRLVRLSTTNAQRLKIATGTKHEATISEFFPQAQSPRYPAQAYSFGR